MNFPLVHRRLLSFTRVRIFHTVIPPLSELRVFLARLRFSSLSYGVVAVLRADRSHRTPFIASINPPASAAFLHITGSMDRRGCVNSLCDLALIIHVLKLRSFVGSDMDQTES